MMDGKTVITAHVYSFLSYWLWFVCADFVSEMIFDWSFHPLRCQWRPPLYDALLLGGIAALLLWWLMDRKRALAGEVPGPGLWWP